MVLAAALATVMMIVACRCAALRGRQGHFVSRSRAATYGKTARMRRTDGFGATDSLPRLPHPRRLVEERTKPWCSPRVVRQLKSKSNNNNNNNDDNNNHHHFFFIHKSCRAKQVGSI